MMNERMTSALNRCMIVLVLAAVSVLAASSADAAGLDSREYKMLIGPKLFHDAKKGCLLLWTEISKAAKEARVKATAEANVVVKKPRFVLFYDTAGHDLYKRGYMLRRRQKSPPNQKKIKYELTLKFRHDSLLAAAAKQVAPGPGYKGEEKLEEDVSVKPDALQSRFSKSGTLETKDSCDLELRALARFFPGVADIGLPPDTRLSQVNGILVREVRLLPGELSFGDVAARVVVSLWYRGESDLPWIAEVSFDYDVTKQNRESRSRRRMTVKEHADFFAQILRDRLGQWVQPGKSKTALVYEAR